MRDQVRQPRGALASGVLLIGLAVALLGAGLASDADDAPLTPDRISAQIAALSPPVEVAPAARPQPEPRKRDRRIPSAARLREARRFVASRVGAVSFAAVNTEGQLRGLGEAVLYPSASVVKAMLLAAELERLKRESIDDATDGLLRAMITHSDNDAADSIYARVGDAGLYAIAERAGMSHFTVAGHWGNAQIAAGDMALMFSRLGRLFVGRHRAYGLGLLGSVIARQSWGIPDAAGDLWAVRFKGGWLPDRALVNQAVELREIDGDRELSIAVLTDSQPSFEYGISTVRGVARRLLGRDDDEDTTTTTAGATGTPGISGATLTKNQFIDEADAICKAGDKEINAAGEQLGQAPQGQALVDFAEDVVIPSIQSQHDAIAALPVPEGEEEEVEELLTALQDAIDALEEDPAQITEGNAAESFQEVNQLAEDFGLTNCGGDS